MVINQTKNLLLSLLSDTTLEKRTMKSLIALAFAALLSFGIVNVANSQEASVPKYWAGEFTGIPSGTFSFEVQEQDIMEDGAKIKGEVRMLAQGRDGIYGYKYALEGDYKVEEGKQPVFTATGKFVEGPEDRPFGDLKAEMTYTINGVMVGEWSSAVGTRGIAKAYPIHF